MTPVAATIFKTTTMPFEYRDANIIHNRRYDCRIVTRHIDAPPFSRCFGIIDVFYDDAGVPLPVNEHDVNYNTWFYNDGTPPGALEELKGYAWKYYLASTLPVLDLENWPNQYRAPTIFIHPTPKSLNT